MTAETWREIEEVAAAALEVPAGERNAFVAGRCAGRAELQAEVTALLAAHERAGGFLEATALAARSLAGRRIGPYRLVDEIGRGGMGVVYRAERDDEQFQKQVAVKVIAGGFWTGESLRRFGHERHILAALEHPHITRLIDAGATEDGVPYIVMEHVEGVPVDRYCAHNALSVAARLRLMQSVCGAVHYAHQNLVVHRDIKPGNILVTADGAPKLLDFGIAKMLDPGPEGAVAATVTRFHAMTPGYASPEQLGGGGATIAGDIYSLGVVLKELLSPKGSALTGDLAAITGKALRPEPDQRYASANELAADIERHLAGQPVLARHGSLRYVAGKFVRRHRLAVALACLALLLVVSAGATALWQARIAERERQKAQLRFDEVRKLANAVVFELHDGIAQLAGSTKVRQLLVTRALEYLDRLAREAEGDSKLQLELATAYKKLGDVQGNNTAANLGDPAAALASYAKSRRALDSVLAREPDKIEALYGMALLLQSTSYVRKLQSELEPALADAERVVALRKKIAALSPGNWRAQEGLAIAYFSLADMRPTSSDEGIALRSAAQEIFERLLEAQPADANRLRNVALAHKLLGSARSDRREFPAALEHLRRALEMDRRRVAADPNSAVAHMDLAYDLSQIGTCYYIQREWQKAMEHYRQALAIRQKLAAADPSDARLQQSLGFVHSRIGTLYLRMGRRQEALQHYRQVELIAARQGQKLAPDALAETYLGLGDLSRGQSARSGVEQACGYYLRAQAIYDTMQRNGTALGGRELAAEAARKAGACRTGK